MSRTCGPSVSLDPAIHRAYVAAGGPPLSTVCQEHEEAWLRAQGLPVPPREAGRTVANGGRAVACVVDGRPYPSMRAAADATGITVQAVSLRIAAAKKKNEGSETSA